MTWRENTSVEGFLPVSDFSTLAHLKALNRSLHRSLHRDPFTYSCASHSVYSLCCFQVCIHVWSKYVVGLFYNEKSILLVMTESALPFFLCPPCYVRTDLSNYAFLASGPALPTHLQHCKTLFKWIIAGQHLPLMSIMTAVIAAVSSIV